jgi:hypothetical protein
LAVIDPQRGGTALVNNSLPFLEIARNLDLGVPKMTAYLWIQAMKSRSNRKNVF